MTNDVDAILALAGLDEEIAEQTTLKRDGEREIVRLKRAVESARDQLKVVEDEIKENMSQQKLLELDLQANQNQIQKIKDFLGKVRSNEEYRQNLQRIEELKGTSSDYEDRILVLMEAKEGLEGKRRQAAAEVERVEQDAASQTVKIEERNASCAARIEELASQRAARAGDVGGEVLDKYERIREMRGEGTARVIDGSCQGCFVSLTLNQINLVVVRKVVQFCPSCGLVLYLDREPSAAG